MRSSYITHFYNANNKYGKRDELNNQMRHYVNTASKHYFKVLEDDKPFFDKIYRFDKHNNKLQGRILELYQIEGLRARRQGI